MQQKKKNDDNTRFIRVSGEICLFFDFDFVSFEKFSKKIDALKIDLTKKSKNVEDDVDDNNDDDDDDENSERN